MLPLLANPISIASLGLTAISTGDKAKDFVANNWKTIAAVLGIAAVGYLAYDKLIKDDGRKGITADPNQPASTLSDQKAQNLADELFEAMRASGSQKQRIYNALTGLSFNDFAKVSQKFGKRYYLNITGEESAWWFPGSEELTLEEWLRRELNAEEMSVVQQIMPSVITKANQPRNGAYVMANKDNTVAYVAEKVNDIWYQRNVDRKYNSGEEIGEIIKVLPDKWQPEMVHLVVDKQGIFNWGDVIVNANDVTVI